MNVRLVLSLSWHPDDSSTDNNLLLRTQLDVSLRRYYGETSAAHAGFVGKGILTAAVAGSVFASPNVSQIRHAINLVHSSKSSNDSAGVLIVVKNYTGDVLHFGLAAEQTRAALSKEEAEKVRVIVVGDDVAVGRSQGGIVGRR